MVSFFLFMLTDEDGTTTTTRNVGKYREIVLDAAHTVASALVADNWTPKTPRTGGDLRHCQSHLVRIAFSGNAVGGKKATSKQQKRKMMLFKQI